MIVVIGATGYVGGAVVDALCDRGERPRIVLRDRAKARRWEGRVEAVVGDLNDERIRGDAFRGAREVFCLSFIEAPPELDRAIIHDAVGAGVRHIVKLSTIGASSRIPIGLRHREREEWIRASGVQWTFLRPGYFMTNALHWVQPIRATGRVTVPVPDSRIAPISERDIAEIARLCLTEPGHAGKVYELTGSELTSAREQIETLSRVLDRPIQCEEIDIQRALARMRAVGRPEWILESLEMMWTGLGDGEGNRRTGTFERLTGHASQSFEGWCDEHRSDFICRAEREGSERSPPSPC